MNKLGLVLICAGLVPLAALIALMWFDYIVDKEIKKNENDKTQSKN